MVHFLLILIAVYNKNLQDINLIYLVSLIEKILVFKLYRYALLNTV